MAIESFNLWYSKKQALFDVNMTVEKGFVTALIGPSGCGKSTLLRSINRMNDLIDGLTTKGKILLDSMDIYHPDVDVIGLRKAMGMVFQKPNPFPMSIADNVSYPLRVDGIRDKKILRETVVNALQAAVLWDEVEDRLQDNALGLSGGQQQRLCIARAIAGNPDVLLMDEPCSAAGPCGNGENRGPYRRPPRPLYDNYCDSQHATGCSCFRQHSVYVFGSAHRVRGDI